MLISKRNTLALLAICVAGLIRTEGVDDLVETKDFALQEPDHDVSAFEEYVVPEINDIPASHFLDEHSVDIEDGYVILEDKLDESPKKDDEVFLPLGEEFVEIERVTVQGPKTAFPLAIDSDVELVRVSAMLSYCTYNKPLTSETDCPAYIKETCGEDHLNSFTFNSMNAVIVCKKNERVFVAFAGTQSYTDEASDLAFFSKTMNLPNRERKFAHGGFVTRAGQFSLWVNSALSSIEGVDRMEIVLTGHSLGGGLATLLAHDIYAGLRLDVHGGVSNALNQVKVITFGTPSVISDASRYPIGHLNHLRFHNPHDIVANYAARLMNNISGYEHVGVELVVPNQPFLNVVKIDKQNQRKAQRTLGSTVQDHQSKSMYPKEGTGKRSILKLTSQPADFWTPEKYIPVYNPITMNSHAKLAYAVLAESVFMEYQRARKQETSLLSLVNVADALEKRLDVPVICKLMANKIICSADSNVIAKFRYARDGESDSIDECMSLIVKRNAIPGITTNAGISLRDMSPNAVASEALILDVSTTDSWYRDVPPKMFDALFMDGSLELPEQCIRKPAYLSCEESKPSERAIIRDSVERPFAYTLLESKDSSAPIIELIKNDMSFFGDQDKEGWIDCGSPSNRPFCPSLCHKNNESNGDPVCAVMKKYSGDGVTSFYVSISGNQNSSVDSNINSWRIVVQEKKPKPYWFSSFRASQVGKEAVITIIQE